MKAFHLLVSLKPGGAENVAINYSKALKQIGIESILIGESDNEIFEEYIKETANVKYKLDIKSLSSGDVIFVHCNKWLYLLLQYLPLIKIKRIRIIYVQHLNYSIKKFVPLSLLINLVCDDFIRITPITESLVNRFVLIRKHYTNNFSINKYADEKRIGIRQAIRNELHFSESQTIICFASIFKKGKGLSDFLALAEAVSNNDNYHFLLLGDGPEANLAKDYKRKNLIWLGRVTDVERYLIASDIFFFPSKLEMMPMAMIEAINTEKRIIAYPTTVNNFLLNHRTFNNITTPEILEERLPSGSELKHYDLDYGIIKLSEILNR